MRENTYIKIETLSSMDAVIKMQTGCIWLLSDGEAAQQDKRVIQELIDQAEHVYIGNSYKRCAMDIIGFQVNNVRSRLIINVSK